MACFVADGVPFLFRLHMIIILRSGSSRGRQIVPLLLQGDCQTLHIQLSHGDRKDEIFFPGDMFQDGVFELFK